jgi:hypothetical protein
MSVIETHLKKNPRHKLHCISGKHILVIDEDIIKRLGINGSTFLEEKLTDNGILLEVCKF